MSHMLRHISLSLTRQHDRCCEERSEFYSWDATRPWLVLVTDVSGQPISSIKRDISRELYFGQLLLSNTRNFFLLCVIFVSINNVCVLSHSCDGMSLLGAHTNKCEVQWGFGGVLERRRNGECERKLFLFVALGLSH